MGANTSDADFLKGLGRGRGSQLFNKRSVNSAGQVVWSDFFFDAAGGAVTGTATTSQAQTIAAIGTAAPQAVSGTATTSQAQTITASGVFTALGVSGDAATSQAQTVAGTGAATVASVSGTGAVSQAQTITASGLFSSGVTGVGATSQGQTAAANGDVVNGRTGANEWYGYLTSYELLNKKKKHKPIETETPEEVLLELPKFAPIEAPDEAKRLLKVVQKKAQREGKAIADAFVTRLIEQAKIRAFEELRVLNKIENQRLEWLAEQDEEDAILLLL